jgi:protein involved in sex pheromone biosynthesis
MKKLLMAAVLSSVLLVNAAFANKDENVSYQVENAFKQEFGQAKNVSWQKTDNYYKAVFTMNNEQVNAYFTPEGEMIGIIHNMLSTQLPINLQTSLMKKYSDYWITDLFEFARPDSNGYFITLHNADQIITLQSTDGSSWTTYSKVKKQ